jgi:hypothetical protein
MVWDTVHCTVHKRSDAEKEMNKVFACSKLQRTKFESGHFSKLTNGRWACKKQKEIMYV